MEHTEETTKRKRQDGFTLVELLISIVVVGILTTVAIVGINSLTNKGATSTCKASVDAAKAAQAVHYANQGSYAADIQALVTAGELDLGNGVTLSNGNLTLTANGSSSNMTASTPTFSACT